MGRKELICGMRVRYGSKDDDVIKIDCLYTASFMSYLIKSLLLRWYKWLVKQLYFDGSVHKLRSTKCGGLLEFSYLVANMNRM